MQQVRHDEGGRSSHSGEKANRHGESASHLLNFTYAPLRGQEDGHRRSSGDQWRRSRARRQVIHTKEQFLQAHCQFVVKKPVTEGEYVGNMVEADKMVEWENIEQVVGFIIAIVEFMYLIRVTFAFVIYCVTMNVIGCKALVGIHQ